MDYNQALKYIYSRELFGIKLGLKNITELMNSLKNPQDKYKTIHVAGTNGKGSVCAFLSSILRKQGYKVGVFTSPHLVDFKERIKVNGKKISKPHLAKLLTKIKPLIKEHTFFEVVTALGFLYFAQQKVDFAIIEVGMGGRLDATNIITPKAALITNVSLEHMHHLGNTIEKIAFEKAGIIKPNIDVITSENGKGLKIIKKICKEKNSKLHIIKPKKVKTSLEGNFQNQNASLALETVKILSKKYKISKKAISEGLSSAKWPGRMEFISKNIVFDCAHNPAGAKAVAVEIKKLKKKFKDVYLILGIMKDKDIKGICNALEPIAKEIIITKPKIPRAAMPGDIAKFIKKKVVAVRNVEEALEYAKLKAGKKGLIVLTGSIFTIGDAFSAIRPEPFD